MNTRQDKSKQIQKIKNSVVGLKKSPLYKYRKDNKYKVVIGEGSLDAKVIFIGEAPGRKEAETGRPFCGASGKVLDELLSSIKLDRELVYITNIVKDRPPENRDPSKAEIALYTPYLKKQIEVIQPKVIATLGRHAMNYIMEVYGLKDDIVPISQAHGGIYRVEAKWGEMKIVPLYHPAVAVYNRKKIDLLKQDFKIVKRLMKSR